MPIPGPKPGERKGAFVGRCFRSPVMRHEFKDRDKRLAICYSQWREVHGGKKPKKKK